MSIPSNVIKQLRLKKRWKQAEVAKKLMISISAYSQIEAGNCDINISRLTRLAEMFNVSIMDLLNSENSYFLQLEEIRILKIRLEEKTAAVVKLQAKLIDLYDYKEKRVGPTGKDGRRIQ